MTNLFITIISSLLVMFFGLQKVVESNQPVVLTSLTPYHSLLVKPQEPKKVAVLKPPSVNELVALAAKQVKVETQFLLNLKNIDRSLYCMAKNTFYEARGESMVGKVAVNLVVVNRTKSRLYPSSECDVVYQSATIDDGTKVCQFSWVCDEDKTAIPLRDSDGDLNPRVMKEWRDSVVSSIIVRQRKVSDFVHGATHFYVYKQVKPSWKNFKVTKVVDSHVFGKIKKS